MISNLDSEVCRCDCDARLISRLGMIGSFDRELRLLASKKLGMTICFLVIHGEHSEEQGNRRKQSHFETAIPVVLSDTSASGGAVQQTNITVNLTCT